MQENATRQSAPIRRLVTRRERRQYACGCSTTRIESYWQPAEGEAGCATHDCVAQWGAPQPCVAHGGDLQLSEVCYAYPDPQGRPGAA